jgi:phage repressor protein C with HTH and peptisase S24 domain
MNDISVRFLEVYNYLREQSVITTPSAFAKEISVSNSLITEICKKRTNAGITPITNLIKRFPYINSNWILTGEGVMQNVQTKKAMNTPKHYSAYKSGTGIPLIPVEAYAGYGAGEVSITEQDIQDRYIVPEFSNVDFMIRIKGSSMYPKFSSGDVIACKVITDPKFIQWNKVHVFSTREQGVLIKRLKKSENPECFLAVSDNLNYDPFDIPKEEILNLAIVTGVIRLE